MTNAYVTQLGRGNTRFSETNQGGESSVLRTYKFYDIWPSNVQQIDLSYDQANSVEEFTVEFQVQYFSIGENAEQGTSQEQDGTTSNTGEQVIQ